MVYEYSCSNRENLPLPVERQLSKIPKFALIFYCSIKIYIKSATFWKQNEPHSWSNSEVVDSERRAYLNAYHISEPPSVLNVLSCLKKLREVKINNEC